jgi:hypothetical protein
MLPIAIIAVVLILVMAMFMFIPTDSCSGGKVNLIGGGPQEDGYRVLAKGIAPTGYNVFVLQFGEEEPFLVYSSMSNLGRWNIFCGNDQMDMEKYGGHYAIGFNLSMEFQKFLDTFSDRMEPVPLNILLQQYPGSATPECTERFNELVRANEYRGSNFSKELVNIYIGCPMDLSNKKLQLMESYIPRTGLYIQNPNPLITMRYVAEVNAKILENNFSWNKAITELYTKKSKVDMVEFEISYNKTYITEKSTGKPFKLYFIKYKINNTMRFYRFTKEYTAPIYIETTDNTINQYGMCKPWVNPYNYICKIIDYTKQVNLSPEEVATRKLGDYVFIGDVYDGLWPLNRSDSSTIATIVEPIPPRPIRRLGSRNPQGDMPPSD